MFFLPTTQVLIYFLVSKAKKHTKKLNIVLQYLNDVDTMRKMKINCSVKISSISQCSKFLYISIWLVYFEIKTVIVHFKSTFIIITPENKAGNVALFLSAIIGIAYTRNLLIGQRGFKKSWCYRNLGSHCIHLISWYSMFENCV